MKSNSREGNIVGQCGYSGRRRYCRRASPSPLAEVGFADGVGFGVDLLAVEVGGAPPCHARRKLDERLLRDGQHAASAAGPVVEQVGARLDRSAMGRKIRLAISLTTSRGVQCSPASSLFSSLNRRMSSSKTFPWRGCPGRAAGPCRRRRGQVGREIDLRSRNFSISLPRASAFDELGSLISQLELVEDLLDVGGETVRGKPRNRLKQCLLRPGLEITQRRTAMCCKTHGQMLRRAPHVAR